MLLWIIAPTCCQALSTIAAGTTPAAVVDFSMALLSFADSAPRAYWLKARNAYLTFFSTSTGTSPNLNLLDLCHIRNIKKIFYSSSACIHPAYNQDDPANPNCSEHSVYPGGAR
jgi:hypothetical protein